MNSKKNKNTPLIIGIFIIILSLFPIYLGIKEYQKTDYLIKNGKEQFAQIIEVKERTGSRGGKTYCPVLEFSFNDQTKSFESNHCQKTGYKVGQELKVLFDPNNLSNVDVKDEVHQRHGGRKSWFIIAGFFMVLGMLIILGAVFDKKPKK